MRKTLTATKTAKVKTPKPNTHYHLVIQSWPPQPDGNNVLVADVAIIDEATVDTPLHDPQWVWIGTDNDSAASIARLIQVAKDWAYADGYRAITIDYPYDYSETQRILPSRTRASA